MDRLMHFILEVWRIVYTIALALIVLFFILAFILYSYKLLATIKSLFTKLKLKLNFLPKSLNTTSEK